jgi:hypothetical protein
MSSDDEGWSEKPVAGLAAHEAEAQALGARRNLSHQGAGTPRFYADADEENRIGAAGEYAFARSFGLVVDEVSHPEGDGGCDFRVPMAGRELRIDVKTCRKPVYLLVKKADLSRKGADVYVLAHFDRDHVVFVGWETWGVMALMPVADFGYGITSHYRAREELRPMSQLVNLLAMRGA